MSVAAIIVVGGEIDNGYLGFDLAVRGGRGLHPTDCISTGYVGRGFMCPCGTCDCRCSAACINRPADNYTINPQLHNWLIREGGIFRNIYQTHYYCLRNTAKIATTFTVEGVSKQPNQSRRHNNREITAFEVRCNCYLQLCVLYRQINTMGKRCTRPQIRALANGCIKKLKLPA